MLESSPSSNSAPSESYHSHHAPLGAFATFTIGLVGGPGGFGYALRGPGRQNVYVGFRSSGSPWQLLPFLNPPQSKEAAFTGESAAVALPSDIQILSPGDYRRTLGWASDVWRADVLRFGFSLLSPFGEVADPARMKKKEARLAFSPHINGWIEYDNRQGNASVELIFGIGDPDSIFRPLQDSSPGLLGFALGTQFAYATAPGTRVESRQGFDVFKPEFRDYQCDHLRGCFSHMTMEQLLNWVLCATTYALHTGDSKWLRKHQSTLSGCAESMRRRDNPIAAKRDGILKHDSMRCGQDGAEITTYDSLDASLGQARNNLYLAVKTLGAWVVLEQALAKLGLKPESRAAGESADQLAARLVTKSDAESGTFPAEFEAGNVSRIIPAVEGFVCPLFLGMSSVAD